jgi:hypothetical protein
MRDITGTTDVQLSQEELPSIRDRAAAGGSDVVGSLPDLVEAIHHERSVRDHPARRSTRPLG